MVFDKQICHPLFVISPCLKSHAVTLNPQFVTDKKGKKLAVQLSVKEYEFLIEELEMKEDIALYKKVKADKHESFMPLNEYLKKRKKK